MNERLQFLGAAIPVEANAAFSGFGPVPALTLERPLKVDDACGNLLLEDGEMQVPEHLALATLKPLGEIRESFILAVNPDGLWIIDQHVAHERVLFEKVLAERSRAAVDGQRLLMPLLVELTPGQQAVFAEIWKSCAATALMQSCLARAPLPLRPRRPGFSHSKLRRCCWNCSISSKGKSRS